MSTAHTEVATPPPAARSAVANGSRLFLDGQAIDGRSAEARRFRDLLADLVAHLGGSDIVTEPQRHLARRAAALAVWCERAEVTLAKGEDMDVSQYVTAANSLRRLLGDLGLQRVAKPVMTLPEYIRQHDERQAKAEAERLAAEKGEAGTEVVADKAERQSVDKHAFGPATPPGPGGEDEAEVVCQGTQPSPPDFPK